MVKQKQPKPEKSDLEEAVSEIKQRFGEGAIMKLKEIRTVDVDVIPTGSISLDSALGVGGVPRGRVIEIFGPEGSGKTTLVLHILAEAQKQGGAGAFVDAEHALDPDWARKIGVNIEDLLISQPDSGEQALQIVETLVRSGEVDVIVVDSVAALVPQAEIEGEMGELQIGLQARMMSQALRKLSGIISKTKTVVIFLNQTRMKIGCFNYDTRVTMADGTTKKIGYLVNNKIKNEVLTYNLKTKQIEAKPIINWFKNGKASEFIQFEVEKPEGNGRSNFACTPEHKVFTSKGYKEAKNIKVGEKVLLVINDWRLTQTQKELKGKKIIPQNIQLNPRSLTIWYQDDSDLVNNQKKAIVLSSNDFQISSIKKLQNLFAHQFNIKTGVDVKNGGAELVLTLNNKETKKFFDIYRYFIQFLMRYKILEKYKEVKFSPPIKNYEEKRYSIQEAQVIAKYIKPKTKSMLKFDIETENHNYLVDGVIVHNSYGNPETTPGGLALKFYSSVRIELRRIAQIKKGEEIIGNRVKAKIVKNKVAAPFKTTEFDIYYNEGISKFSDIINVGLKTGIIKKAGSWLQYENTKLGQGMEASKTFLKENPEIAEKIKKQLLFNSVRQ